jgi:hypothetical protein
MNADRIPKRILFGKEREGSSKEELELASFFSVLHLLKSAGKKDRIMDKKKVENLLFELKIFSFLLMAIFDIVFSMCACIYV